MNWKNSTIVSIALILLLLLCTGTEMIIIVIMIIVVIVFVAADYQLEKYVPDMPSVNRKIISVLAATAVCVIIMVVYNLR